MSHTSTNLITHVIFNTRERAPLIAAPLHDDLLAFLGGIVREFGGLLRAANARPDRVYLLCSLPAMLATSDALRLVKTNSSRAVHRERALPGFDWQAGNRAFRVSHSLPSAVTRYIAEQGKHLRRDRIRGWGHVLQPLRQFYGVSNFMSRTSEKTAA